MVIFGVKCTVTKQAGYDVYGNKLLGAVIQENCAVVKIQVIQHGTTVRVDAGATRGGAEEYRADAVLLMNKASKVAIDDVVEIAGHSAKIRVTEIRQRHNVLGRLDHLQIEGLIER